MSESTHFREQDAERVIAETLCPPSHREGMVTHMVGQPTKFGPTRICVLHSVMAKNVTQALIEARIIPPGEEAADA